VAVLVADPRARAVRSASGVLTYQDDGHAEEYGWNHSDASNSEQVENSERTHGFRSLHPAACGKGLITKDKGQRAR
jgi:hypothetical protein